MRTTIDLPDALIKQIEFHTANKKVTFRSLLITALEKELSAEKHHSAYGVLLLATRKAQ